MNVALTAGGRISGAYAEAAGTTIKALAPVGDATMLAKAIAAARGAGAERIAVVGGEEVERACRRDVDRVVGESEDGRENLLVYGDMVFNSMGPRNERLAKSTARVAEVTQWIMAHCQRDKLKPNGFGDQIYQAADAGEIDPQHAPMLVRSFLSAGVDTTINGIGNALYSLAHHPDQYAMLHADASLARPAFEEALRWESTVQTFFRTAAGHCEIAGIPVRDSTKVLCMLASANRDPRKWPEPNRFDIQRRPTGHMALGSGIHGCVGQAVARLEGEVVLTALAKRVKRIEVAGPHTRRLNNTLRALETLPLHLIPV